MALDPTSLAHADFEGARGHARPPRVRQRAMLERLAASAGGEMRLALVGSGTRAAETLNQLRSAGWVEDIEMRARGGLVAGVRITDAGRAALRASRRQ